MLLKALMRLSAIVIAVYVVIVCILYYKEGALLKEAFLGLSPEDALSLYKEYDVTTWTSEELASQMLFIMNDSNDPVGLYILAQQGIGGVVLSGNIPVDDIADQIRWAQAETARDIKMFIASDEEGGSITRLQALLGELPSHAKMGSWSSRRITQTVRDYGEKLDGIGVNVALAPVADLKVKGSYMAERQRAFAVDPDDVARCVVAWQKGMHEAGLAVAPKHWPGMGSANDTHHSAAVIHPFEILKSSDMIPFEAAFREGVEMVMVGHAVSSGLTEPNTPATVSRQALTYLREQVGDDVIITTDAMYMSGASGFLDISPAEAVVQSAIAGADLVMTIVWQEGTVEELTAAIDNGRLRRTQAEDSVRRILRLKAKMGLVPVEVRDYLMQ